MNREELTKLLRKYNTQEVLMKISNETRGSVLEHKPLENLEMTYVQNGFIKKHIMPVGAWMYTDLAYEMILHSNDHRGKIPTFDEFVYLLGKINEFKDLEMNEKMSIYNGMELGTFIIFGHAQKQFWYQIVGLMIEQYFRNIDIFINIPKNITAEINFNEVIKQEIGYSIDEYIQSLMYIWLIGLKQDNFNNIEFKGFKNKKINEKCVKDIIEKYTIDYKNTREDNYKVKDSVFLFKPIIKTQKNNLIVVNGFLLFRLLSDGLFWTIRNHFNKKEKKSDRQKFVNYFGELFEIYVKELLGKYLEEKKFKRLENTNCGKIADWIIKTEKYFLIVEQKSAIMAIKTKSFTPDIDPLKNFINDNYNKKGTPQLDETEEQFRKEISGKQVIKIILYYETIFAINMVKILLLEMRNETTEERNNLFFLSISEFERLLVVLNKDEEIFNRIIEEKLLLEKLPLKDGTDITKIFEKYGMNTNEYIDSIEKVFFDELMSNIEEIKDKEGE